MKKIGGLPFPEQQAVKSIDDSNPFAELKAKVLNRNLDFHLAPVKLGKRQIIIGHVPSKSNCYRIVTFKSKDPNKQGYSTLAKTKDLKLYEKNFALQCSHYRNMNLSEPFKFEMDVYYPNKRNDLDGSLKCVLDCLQEVKAISNDNLCQELLIRRHIDAQNPRVEFIITKANG